MTRRLYDYEQEQITKAQYRDGLKAWIQSQDWDDFITITFRKEIRDRVFSIKRASAGLLNATWVSRALLVAEKGNLTPSACHVHGLVAYHDDCFSKYEHRTAAWSNLFNACGRSRIEPIVTKAAVASYCSKYITKDQDFEWNFYGCGYYGS